MSFFKRLTAVKPTDIAANDKKFYQITCYAGAGIALVTAVLMLIMLAGFAPVYTWSAVAFGLGLGLFFGLAALRYFMPHSKLIARISDACVYLTLVGAYTPIALCLVMKAPYENGTIVDGWLLFGLVAFFSLIFFIASLCSTRKLRLLGSLVYMVLACLLPIGATGMIQSYFFAPALAIIFMVICMLAFAASPVIFWFFDRRAWQMKVYYILMASGTLSASLCTLLWVFCGR